jgi:hypothetical protein
MKSKNGKPAAAAFRRVAEQFAEHLHAGYEHGVTQYSCCAVGHGVGYSAEESYRQLFAQRAEESDLWWVSARRKRSIEDRTNLRVLMLCFAAAMAETGDL